MRSSRLRGLAGLVRWLTAFAPRSACSYGLLSQDDERETHLRDLAAESAQVCFDVLPSETSEGAGNAGRSMRPQPRMQNKKAYESSHHGHTGVTRHSPRNGFNGFLRALPGDRALLSPSPADHSANLMPASGHQNHTTSPSASRAIRQKHHQHPSHPAPRS